MQEVTFPADAMPPALHSYGPLEPVSSAPRVVVLRGRDPRSGKAVAIKIVGALEENRPRSERVVDRVFNALTGLKSAGHPSVPRILEVGRIGGGAVFLVSEWVEGHVLEAPLDVPPQTVLNYATQVVSVLESMARYGLAHLNLRPTNLMVDATGRVQLLGLASGYLVDSGSLQRNAPELSTQLASGGALWRCDLYSLASTTCQLLGVKVEGAGSPVPFVGFPDEVSRQLRGSEGLRLVLESALHRAATRRPASLGVFRRALLNCLDDAEENRPIPLQPLPIEYRSETGSVHVKDSAPVLLFEAEDEEPAEVPANDASGALEVPADVVAEPAEVPLEVAASSASRATVDLDADLAEYVALGSAGMPQETIAFEHEPVAGRLRLVANEPSTPQRSEVLVAKAGEGLSDPETVEEAADEQSGADAGDEQDSLAESEAAETSTIRGAEEPKVPVAGSQPVGAEPAALEGVADEADRTETTQEEAVDREEAVEASAQVQSEDSVPVSEGAVEVNVAENEATPLQASVAAAETVAIEASNDGEDDIAPSLEEKTMTLEPQQQSQPDSGDISKEFVLGRDLVPEELLDGAAAAAEAAMPEAHRSPDFDALVTASIELDEGTSIGADSGTLRLDEVVATAEQDSEDSSDPANAATQAIAVSAESDASSIGDVPTAEDLFDEHQPEANGNDLRRTMPLELVKSELEDERLLEDDAASDAASEDADETLEQVLSGAALARPGDSDDAFPVAESDASTGEESESFVDHDAAAPEEPRVAALSNGDLAEWSTSVETVEAAEAPAVAFAGSSAKKKGSALFSANAIRGLFVVAAVLWAAFAVLWFRQEGRRSLGEPVSVAAQTSAPSLAGSETPAAAPVATEPQVDTEAVSAAATPETDPAPAAEPAGLEPAPLVSSVPSTDSVEAAVRAWASSWSSQDVEGYLSSYSQSFRPNNGASRSQWASYRRDRVSAPSSVSVTLDDLEVSIDGDRATAVFRQTYASDSMSDQVVKTLTLANESEGWKILSEVSKPLG